ncbi:MAG: hypothetical protein Q4E29_01705 [Lachnospiraceae bacterium]|nr:hypothetical protein [Lachnospiraceae bacterium]
MIKQAIKDLAVSTLIETLKPYADDAKDALMNTARDTLESAITGRRSIEEWAEIAIKGVDKVKKKVVEQNGWKYIGGKLNFQLSETISDKVVISYELYYQDSDKNWQKVSAESDMYVSNFTLEALEDIKTNGKVSYEVE